MDVCGERSTLEEEIEHLRRENGVLKAKLMRYAVPNSSSSVLSKPHEVLLDIIRCVDFNTLVRLRFTNSVVWECVNRHAPRLARERKLYVTFTDDGIEMTDCDDASWSLSVEFSIKTATAVQAAQPMFHLVERARTLFGGKPTDATDVESVLRKIGHQAGCHRITNVSFQSGYWLKVPFEVFSEAIPAIEYARWIGVNNGRALQGSESIENFVANFVRLEQLYLFEWRATSFDWTILRSEALRRLIFLKLERQMVENASELSVNELCCYLSDVVHMDRSRTVRISHGWTWPQAALFKIAKVIGEARAPIILSIAAERPQLMPLFGAETGWSGYRSVYRIRNALLLDDGDDVVPGCLRWTITNHLLLGFF